MPNGTYGGVRGKGTKVGQKSFVSRPTRLGFHYLHRRFGNYSLINIKGAWLVISGKFHALCQTRIQKTPSPAKHPEE